MPRFDHRRLTSTRPYTNTYPLINTFSCAHNISKTLKSSSPWFPPCHIAGTRPYHFLACESSNRIKKRWELKITKKYVVAPRTIPSRRLGTPKVCPWARLFIENTIMRKAGVSLTKKWLAPMMRMPRDGKQNVPYDRESMVLAVSPVRHRWKIQNLNSSNGRPRSSNTSKPGFPQATPSHANRETHTRFQRDSYCRVRPKGQLHRS